ncbi:MAG: hypothetical protein A2751_05020 [Candidatus Doudnabacteria bacterium RIFCSPHIGHO2_01_FULL_46_14]|uniref:NadR/Ttd14 AAA domain-containing protein n=1 Tax=Candidatus Doudnabacteria bacterium RIFCSPHIGHO2_01_FULL_46_14 TaxID=1817824 RepID=A0A1F5NNQ9_9BACT|nr:MAG: hypothetical protein A2751_05020 [Candidatus Doudnabacteria bacterium RIFCSPHIGHO2_01_FULL_46_14]
MLTGQRESATNHIVLTGYSCSGKTTMLHILKSLGFSVLEEESRVIMDEWEDAGLNAKEERLRFGEQGFQKLSFSRQRVRDSKLDPNQLWVLDLGWPCQAPFFENCGLSPGYVLKHCAPKWYRRILFFEEVEFEDDYARTETPEERARIGEGEWNVYVKELGYKPGIDIVGIPAFPGPKQEAIEQRAKFVLANMF